MKRRFVAVDVYVRSFASLIAGVAVVWVPAKGESEAVEKPSVASMASMIWDGGKAAAAWDLRATVSNAHQISSDSWPRQTLSGRTEIFDDG